jgi:hypothetical protein
MSTLERNDRPTLAPAVKTVLDDLRRRIRRYVWLEGVAGAILWLGAAFWITLAVDWFFEPPVWMRASILAIVGIVLAVIVVQRIVRRIFVRITDDNAAMVLERRFPQLGDSLLTGVSLTGLCTDEVDSAMLARTCDEAARRIADVDLKRVFNPWPLRQQGFAAGLLVGSVVLFATLYFQGFCVWTQRMLALAEERWPRNTRLEVEGFAQGVQKIARGSDLEVVARADTAKPWVPDVVEVRYRTEGGHRGRATMDRRGIAHAPEDSFQEYAYTFRGVLADIHFDVVGGDDRVDELWIRVVDSPTISKMTLQCELPAYIGHRERTLPVSGVMQIPMGSRITVHAQDANKDLVRVEVGKVVEGRSAPTHSNRLGKSIEKPQDAVLTSDRRGFSYTLEPLMEDTTLLFTLTDADGIRSRDPVRLVLTPLVDQPPRMAVQLDGIGTAVTPQAKIPVVGQIDDDYGIGRVWFEYALEQKPQSRHVIGEFSDSPTTEFRLADAALELRDMGLKPGQKLSVCVKAADLCELGHGSNVAGGERWLLEVVTPAQLRSMLESRELVLRQRFERMIEEMTETRDLLARLEFAAPPAKVDKKADEEAADSPARQQALRLLRVEGATTNCRKSTQEVLGLAEAFDDIRKQLVNNRIDTEELKNRLQGGIAEPLRAIAHRMFPELEGRLESLRAALDDPQKGPGLRDRARKQADDILLAMRKVRDRMIELEDFNEAIELLRGIIQGQEQLREKTQQRHKQKIHELLKE